MENDLITVVIPVYKVEKYIDRCLNSVVNQTYGNLEIILVDDGSPDKCPLICDEWAKRDKRIKVVHKKNEGLGMARNTGIDFATGKYICFFDSDDYIALNIIEKAYESIKSSNSDIAMFGLYSVNTSGKIVSKDIPTADKGYYKGSEVIEFILPNMIAADPKSGKRLGFNMSAWGRMYSMDLINKNNWRFVSEREYISEDFYSLLELYKYVKSTSIVAEGLYYYCYNDSSLTHIFKPERYKQICICHKGMMNICGINGYPQAVRTCIDSQFLGSVIAAMKLLILSDLPEDRKKKEICNIIKDQYLQEVLEKMDTRNETLERKIIIAIIKKKISVIAYKLLKIKSH